MVFDGQKFTGRAPAQFNSGTNSERKKEERNKTVEKMKAACPRRGSSRQGFFSGIVIYSLTPPDPDPARPRLNQIGFVWAPADRIWDELYLRLVKYKGKHGDCDVPSSCPSDQRLAHWVVNQRHAKKARILIRLVCPSGNSNGVEKGRSRQPFLGI